MNGYSVNNQALYAAIWQKISSPPMIARHGMSAAQYQTEFNTQTANGYRPAHISAYTVNNQPFFAAIWVKTSGPAWIARHGLTAAQYQEEFDTQGDNGYQLVDVSGYNVNGVNYYAAVWEQFTDRPWIGIHGLTSAQYQAEVDDLKHQGYRPILVNGFNSNGSDRYVAIFKNYVYTQTELNKLNAPLWAYHVGKSAPSVSVAVTKGGKLVYARVIGLAIRSGGSDVQTTATSASRYRIMSISKSITAVAIMRMAEKKLISLDDKVFGTTGILGADYSSSNTNVDKIKVRHLLNHSAGGWGAKTTVDLPRLLRTGG